MPKIDQLVGKTFTLKLEGRTRSIGEIDEVAINPGRTTLDIRVRLLDEEIAGLLGSAADKAEAGRSAIGLTEAEIEQIIEASEKDAGV